MKEREKEREKERKKKRKEKKKDFQIINSIASTNCYSVNNLHSYRCLCIL